MTNNAVFCTEILRNYERPEFEHLFLFENSQDFKKLKMQFMKHESTCVCSCGVMATNKFEDYTDGIYHEHHYFTLVSLSSLHSVDQQSVQFLSIPAEPSPTETSWFIQDNSHTHLKLPGLFRIYSQNSKIEMVLKIIVCEFKEQNVTFPTSSYSTTYQKLGLC